MAWAPGVPSVDQSVAAACAAGAVYPFMNALTRHMLRLFNLSGYLARHTFQYSKTLAVLTHIVRVWQPLLQLTPLRGSQ